MNNIRRLPKSVAIIMDGNGRWAEGKELSRICGYEKGAEVVRTITEESARLQLKELTLYSLSIDNLRRPAEEISFLMNLFKKYLIEERPTIMKNNIVFTIIGRIDLLPNDIIYEVNHTIKLSEKNTGMVLRLAINYSGKMEIIDAVNKLLKHNNKKEINEAYFRNFLYDPKMSEPDLLIRTGGQYRLSDFLLWHLSYTELSFTDVLWPDFTIEIFHKILENYSQRERKFGLTYPVS